MRVKDIVEEDFVNYKKPAMLIAACSCDWKCCKEQGIRNTICQNQPLTKLSDIEIPADEIFRRYSRNKLTKAIVIAGLEPMLQFDEVIEVIVYFRNHGCDDVFVLYTGYYPEEISAELNLLRQYQNIIVKFGRYEIDSKSRFDEVLGVTLNSENQFAVKIS